MNHIKELQYAIWSEYGVASIHVDGVPVKKRPLAAKRSGTALWRFSICSIIPRPPESMHGRTQPRIQRTQNGIQPFCMFPQ